MGLKRAFRGLVRTVDPAGRRIRRELARLAGGLPPARSLLDLGSGAKVGPYAPLFRPARYVSSDLLAAAQVRCEAALLPFGAGQFDLVLCTEVLEHVADPQATLREILRVLEPGGRLVLTTPLTWGVHEARDFHRWTEQGLRQLLAGAGLALEVLRPRGGILLCLGAMLLVIPWQLFGASAERRPWQSLLYGLSWLLLVLPALALAAADGLDRRRQFTHGYVALCRAPGG